jgi:hypothetical protein
MEKAFHAAIGADNSSAHRAGELSRFCIGLTYSERIAKLTNRSHLSGMAAVENPFLDLGRLVDRPFLIDGFDISNPLCLAGPRDAAPGFFNRYLDFGFVAHLCLPLVISFPAAASGTLGLKSHFMSPLFWHALPKFRHLWQSWKLLLT